MSQWLKGLILSSGLWGAGAYADFLPPDQAFEFQAVSISQDQAELTWKIADGYYLYHDQFKVTQQQRPVSLTLPKAQDKDDPNFGLTQVHYGQVKTTMTVQPQQTFTVQWQGCAESGLCYPVQRTTIQTDDDGLLPAQQLTQQPQLFQPKAQTTLLPASDPIKNAIIQAPEPDEANLSPAPIAADSQSSSMPDAGALATDESSPALNMQQQPVISASATSAQASDAESLSQQWNNDQFFFTLLSEQNLVFNLLIFLGLGVLLAFLPCSLPLIPILSSILVQQHRGYRAAGIALAFVFGMAAVYALMGFAVAQLGYSFQRWFQSPLFISLFSVLFIAFALNLFGAFQLSLPQGLLQRLDRWQQKQQGGTLMGAALMGVLAALIVGPCMSAPLAGALLFVSQLNQPAMGASYLFVLGLGLGLPLFIAAVFGAQYLPRPGVWMDRLKFAFGFVMLALALYFARPLLSTLLYLGLLAAVLLALALYLLFKVQAHLDKPVFKVLIISLSTALAYGASVHVYQAWQHSQIEQLDTRVIWHKVNQAQQLEALLVQYPDQAVVIDVYADWCIACQPIEKDVIPRSDVQSALQNVLRIKLDLTEYHASQDDLLKEWQILGPPTFIFLNSAHQEQRDLRLTGTFSAVQLLNRMQQIKGLTP